MFRIKGGHVDYRTRYARNARWKAQHAARQSLFGMYRNPSTDHASVAGLNRGTANTQLFLHHGKLLVFKEDSPPVAMDPLTLDTIDPEYTFGGKLLGKTHTAHPKIDPKTGGLISFGYEATGFLSKDINVFETDKAGTITWQVMVKAPYAGMMHDFCVTQDYIVLYLVNMVADENRIKAGGVHFSYDSKTPCYMGVMRRGGDGSDLKWLTGPNLFCTHVMGGWNDGNKNHRRHGWRRRQPVHVLPQPARTVRSGEGHWLHPPVHGRHGKARRLHLSGEDHLPGNRRRARPAGRSLSHAALSLGLPAGDRPYALSEMCFVPRSPTAAEGDGYLIGLGSSLAEHGRSDLILFDLANTDAGPRARVKMPYRCVGQVHGFWADAGQIPGASAA